MPVFRVEKTKSYTVMANYHLQDARLSLKAKGMLSLILSLPDDWDYTVAGLAALSRDGKDAVRSCLEELGAAGYIIRSRCHNADGTFGGNEYIVYEQPHTSDSTDGPSVPLSENPTMDAPSSGNPSLEKPSLENPTEQNTKRINTKRINPPISPQGEIEGGKAKKDKPALPHNHEAYRCAQYLDKEICARLPKKQPANEATLQSWAADFDKCHRIDGYDWRTVMDTLIFSQKDSFWQVNILSGRKFRGKMLQLMAKASGGGRAAPAEMRVAERKGVREL